MKKIFSMLWIFALLCVCARAAEKPFVWSASRLADGRVAVRVVVAPQCYLYRAETRISASGAVLEREPKTVRHDDGVSGAVEVYASGTHEWRFADAAKLTEIPVAFQGCRDAGDGEGAMCFPPRRTVLKLPGAAAPKTVAETPANAEVNSALPAKTVQALAPYRVVRRAEGVMNETGFIRFLLGGEEARIAHVASQSILWFCLLVLAGGLGLNLTPCVLPMIPVNLAIIGAGKNQDKWTGFKRGAAYGVGITAAYGVLGVIAVLTGAKFGTLNANAYFNFGIAALFLFLALSMLGWFNLDFSSYQSRVDPRRTPGGALAAAVACGAVAALLAGACVAPVVVSVIVFAAGQYAEGHYPALALPFLLGLGMALPWPLAGAGMRLLPKPGAWMNVVKKVFAGLIFLMAAYYLWLGWTLLPRGGYDAGNEFAKLETALGEAAAAKQPVVIDFWATWCKNCREMDRVLHAAPVKEAMTGMKLVRFQAEKPDDPATAALLDRFGLHGLPGFVLLNVKDSGR